MRSRPSVVIFSPKDPGERAKEGYLEDGEARWEKREESMMCTWRGEEVGAVAQWQSPWAPQFWRRYIYWVGDL